MLSSNLLKYLQFSVTCASIFKVIPFEWDRNNHCLKRCSSKWGNQCWWFTRLFAWCHQVYLFIRLGQSFSDSHSSISFLALTAMYTLAHLCCCVLHIHLSIVKNRVLGFTNHYIEYLLLIQSKLNKL